MTPVNPRRSSSEAAIADRLPAWHCSTMGRVVGMLPLLLLTVWAALSGHFRDVERPKFRMFEIDAEIERGGELERLPMGVRRGA